MEKFGEKQLLLDLFMKSIKWFKSDAVGTSWKERPNDGR